MVVAFPAGGSDDILRRIVASRLSELLGQTVVVENIGGVGGTTGTAQVAKVAPDGYQFVLGTSATHALSQVLRKNRSTIPLPISRRLRWSQSSRSCWSRARILPANLREFIAYAKANQAKMQDGSAGADSATHLVCALFDAAIERHPSSHSV
jgi:tripartite-type tricarboxylate transporter receptor subunit TctC